MFGTREEFGYVECGKCGTLQISELPDLSKHYPAEYYSLDSADAVEMSKGIKRRIAARLIGRYLLKRKGRLGRYLAYKRPWIRSQFPASLRVRSLNLKFKSRILDFGCGAGQLLQTLHYFGFRDLTGADAFIKSDLSYSTGVKVYKKKLSELEPAFDLIMLHHSFEHFPDPHEALAEVKRLLSPDGACLIRIPLAAEAWRKYGTDWVQLDPPRHLFLFTENSFRQTAESARFNVEKVVYDSEAFQFWGSEQYRRGIPMNDPRAFKGDYSTSIFTRDQIEAWERRARELNLSGLGDQACFYLRPKS